MFANNDPAVTWLVTMNFVMAGVVLVCCLLLAGAVVREILQRIRRPASVADDHAFALPELGFTMADGGEREDDEKKRKR